jgi:hypothetical protein
VLSDLLRLRIGLVHDRGEGRVHGRVKARGVSSGSKTTRRHIREKKEKVER